MGFLQGSATFSRYRVPKALWQTPEDAFIALTLRRYGTQRVARKDGAHLGWIAGDTINDLEFSREKNFIGDEVYLWQMRVTQNRIPKELFDDFLAQDLAAHAKENLSGKPSKKQKKEARAASRDRIDELGKDGRWLRSKLVPILYDVPAGILLFGSTSETFHELFWELCKETFDIGFERISAGSLGVSLLEPLGLHQGIQDAKPAPFWLDEKVDAPAWIPDLFNRDWLGNEFFVWLWHRTRNDPDFEVAFGKPSCTLRPAIVRTCQLAHRVHASERQTIAGDVPNHAVAFKALQAGCLPRKLGLCFDVEKKSILFSLDAETFAVSGLTLPSAEETEDQARRLARVGQLRAFLEGLDTLYLRFLEQRAQQLWKLELAKIRKWIGEGKKVAA